MGGVLFLIMLVVKTFLDHDAWKDLLTDLNIHVGPEFSVLGVDERHAHALVG